MGDEQLLLPIEAAVRLDDRWEVVRQIQIRKEVRNQMVGQLYPGILIDEITRLVKRYEELGGRNLAEDLYQIGNQGTNR